MMGCIAVVCHNKNLMLVSAILVSLLLTSPPKSPDPDRWLAIGSFGGDGSSCLSSNWSLTRVQNLQPGNWVSAWNGFAVLTSDGIGSLGTDGRITKRSQIRPDYASRPRQWAVSADGKLLGEFEHSVLKEPRLEVRELRTGRVVRRLGRVELERVLGRAKAEMTAYEGVAFSPSGSWFAFQNGFGAPLDNGGLPVVRTAILNLENGHLRNLGHGSPVAWISQSRLLVNTYLGVAVKDIHGRRISYRNAEVTGEAWDGEAVLLFRQTPKSIRMDRTSSDTMTLERWTPDLRRRVSARSYAALQWVDVNSGVFAAPREMSQ